MGLNQTNLLVWPSFIRRDLCLLVPKWILRAGMRTHGKISRTMQFLPANALPSIRIFRLSAPLLNEL